MSKVLWYLGDMYSGLILSEIKFPWNEIHRIEPDIESLDPHLLAFGKLLCAMYGEPYRVSRPSGHPRTGKARYLPILTAMADYYDCLPMFSRSLDQALKDSWPTVSFSRITNLVKVFFHSNMSRSKLPRFAQDLIESAIKLRHAGLFLGLCHHSQRCMACQ